MPVNLNILVIIFTMSLIYLASGTRLNTYVRVLVLQGIILFVIALGQLGGHIDVPHLLFILLETLIVKAIVVPYFLNRIISRTSEVHEIEPNSSNFASVFFVALIMIGTFMIAYELHEEHLKTVYFTASISSIFVGLFLIVIRKKILTHIMCFIVIENGIFLLSLAIGKEMPAIVSMGIFLDVFTSILVLGMFVNRIRNVFNTMEIEKLSELKD